MIKAEIVRADVLLLGEGIAVVAILVLGSRNIHEIKRKHERQNLRALDRLCLCLERLVCGQRLAPSSRARGSRRFFPFFLLFLQLRCLVGYPRRPHLPPAGTCNGIWRNSRDTPATK